MSAKPAQSAQVRGTRQLTIVEDHLTDGGFGSWLLESVVGEMGLVERIRIKALKPDVCRMVGSQAMLNALGGLECWEK